MLIMVWFDLFRLLGSRAKEVGWKPVDGGFTSINLTGKMAVPLVPRRPERCLERGRINNLAGVRLIG
ncbi:hypothetical protein HMPREF0868_0050 [Mageeibacillus indolicus UPII9-5]|uniref:Uncharacterized protein n=1 Tax=Mageeibacillus indolicus (strain UPII9-5) TaxID=699246 RepID=D3QZP9_MAGIU|nr:hypothetical protein [Mageeibacillus indolicus]ADC90920.1 hypothetical protein HMPREF0868_0050 [Mageeibacillus indolicus UPII9-5]